MFSIGLDTGFGQNGDIALDLAPGRPELAEVTALQSDGKVLVGGDISVQTSNGTESRGVLLRLNADGSLDTSFGGSGGIIVCGDLANAYLDGVSALTVQPDGKIIAAGSVWVRSVFGMGNPFGGARFGVARFNADGTLDSTFGSGRGAGGGFASVDIAEGGDYPSAVIVAPDGKIVVVGKASAGFDGDRGDFGVARFTADGRPDTTFSGDGAVAIDLTPSDARFGEDWARAVAVDAEGDILVGGYAYRDYDGVGGASTSFAIVRLKNDGTLDLGFGDGGKLTTLAPVEINGAITSISGEVDALFVQPNGGFIAGGRAYAHDSAITFIRFNQDGSIDPTFGQAGFATTRNDDVYYQGFRFTATTNGGFDVIGLGGQKAFLNRFDGDGTLTAAFTKQYADDRAFTEPYDYVIQPDGKIVGVGRTAPQSQYPSNSWIYTNNSWIVRLEAFPIMSMEVSPQPAPTPAPAPDPQPEPEPIRVDDETSAVPQPQPIFESDTITDTNSEETDTDIEDDETIISSPNRHFRTVSPHLAPIGRPFDGHSTLAQELFSDSLITEKERDHFIDV